MPKPVPDPIPRRDLVVLIQHLLPLATDQVRAALTVGTNRSQEEKARQRQAEALFLDAQGQTPGVQAALISAASELQRVCLAGADLDRWTTAELATELIRIAYNRWQRRHRSDKRLQSQAARGAGREKSDVEPTLAQAVKNSPDLHAHIRLAIDEVVGTLSDRGRQVLGLRLEGMTQEEVAQQLGCHRATVSRIEAQVRDALSGLWAE